MKCNDCKDTGVIHLLTSTVPCKCRSAPMCDGPLEGLKDIPCTYGSVPKFSATVQGIDTKVADQIMDAGKCPKADRFAYTNPYTHDNGRPPSLADAYEYVQPANMVDRLSCDGSMPRPSVHDVEMRVTAYRELLLLSHEMEATQEVLSDDGQVVEELVTIRVRVKKPSVGATTAKPQSRVHRTNEKAIRLAGMFGMGPKALQNMAKGGFVAGPPKGETLLGGSIQGRHEFFVPKKGWYDTKFDLAQHEIRISKALEMSREEFDREYLCHFNTNPTMQRIQRLFADRPSWPKPEWSPSDEANRKI